MGEMEDAFSSKAMVARDIRQNPELGESSATSALLDRYGVSQEQLKSDVKQVFLRMYACGITDLRIQRDGSLALVTVDGKITI